MTPEEIRAGLAEYSAWPHGRARVQHLEALAAEARQASDRVLEADVLLGLVQAYEYSSERDQLPIAMGRLLRLLDEFPAEVGPVSRTIHWQLKWMTGALIDNPAVPLPAIHRWLDELGSRYRQQGYSLRPVLAHRAGLTLDIGDSGAASAQMEAAIAAPRDNMSDCQACERNRWGRWRAQLGDDAGALEFWAPVLEGTSRCLEEPHRVLAHALLPLARSGRLDEARGAHLRGYPLVRHVPHLRTSVAEHIEFCALTGNEARGLEILTEHADWLADIEIDTVSRVLFAAGVCVLLRRLTGLGQGDLALGPGTVGGRLAVLEQEVRGLSDRYDVRNGTTAFSDRQTSRLVQQPVAGRLPLGAPSRLPGTGSAWRTPGTTVPVASSPAGPAPQTGASATLDDLVARARQLSDERHPQARQAWEQVAAAGQNLPADVTAELARQRAGARAQADPRSGYEALLAVAARFADLGDAAGEYEARASAAMAQAQAGDQAGADELLAAAIASADAAFGRGALTPREYLAVRRARPLGAIQSLTGTSPPDQAAITAAAGLIETELTEAQRLGVRRYEAMYTDLLGQLSSGRGDQNQARAYLEDARRLYLEAGEPWSAATAEGRLARFALNDGDAPAAERLAREAIGHGGALLPPPLAAGLGSLLSDALSAQPGREEDLVNAALTAAAQWEGLSEPDSVHQTFQAARGYGRLGRHGEAASLFAEVMPRVHLCYEPPVIARSRDQYGSSLRALGRHREAAGEFLRAAALIQDDPGNAGPHAHLAGAAAESLGRAGQFPEALTAFRRAAELYAGLGDVANRVRCLRSAAWLEFSGVSAGSQDHDAGGRDAGGRDAGAAGRAGISAMEAVLGELTQLAALAPDGDAGLLAEELTATRAQLDEMRTELDSPGPEADSEAHDAGRGGQ